MNNQQTENNMERQIKQYQQEIDKYQEIEASAVSHNESHVKGQFHHHHQLLINITYKNS